MSILSFHLSKGGRGQGPRPPLVLEKFITAI